MVDVANAFAGIEAPGQYVDQQAQLRAAQQAGNIQLQQLQAAARKAAEDQARLKAAQEAAIRNPSLATYNALQVLNPAGFQGYKAAHDALSADERDTSLRELSAIRGYLKAGQPDAAQRLIQRRIDADREAGQDTADDEEMLALIGEDATQAAGYVDYALAGAMGPEKWAQTFEQARADAESPSKIAKTEAEAAVLNEGLPFVAPQAAAKIAETQANADYLTAGSTVRAQTIAEGPPLSAQAAAAVNGYVEKGATARSLGERATTLADQIANQPAALFSGGFGADWANLAANLGMEASDMVELRRQFSQIRQAQAIQNLPPGPATDRDIKLAMKGLPGANADRETVISFLRGMSKAQDLVAASEEAKADWLSNNSGSLGTARRGFFVGDDFVEPGMTFSAYQRQQIEARARNFAQTQAAPEEPATAPRAPARTGPLTGATPNMIGAF